MPSYVVYKGKVPEVYEYWEDYRRQVHRFRSNSYKGYTTREEGALEEPDEDEFHRDDAHRDDRSSLLCDGSLDYRYRLVM